MTVYWVVIANLSCEAVPVKKRRIGKSTNLGLRKDNHEKNSIIEDHLYEPVNSIDKNAGFSRSRQK